MITNQPNPSDRVWHPRYAGLPTFASLPTQPDVVGIRVPEEGYDVAIVGVPFDAGTSYRPGARFGPTAVRDASRLLRPYNPAQAVEPFGLATVVDAGDVPCTPFDIVEAIRTIEQFCTGLVATGASLMVIGGDHTVALPVLRAVARQHGRLALVHFDAHLDTWESYQGAPYTHGTPFRRAFEEGLLAEEACMHVGVRGPLYAASDLIEDRDMGFAVVTASECGRLGPSEVLARIRNRVGNHPVYVSIDVDVLDPAHAPGTGTPEAGGMTSRELLDIIRALRAVSVVGADVVEVSPPYDHAALTAIAAAHLTYELVTLLALRSADERSNGD